LSLFKRRRFPVEIILLCVRWYCKYGISYRNLAEMMQERGVGRPKYYFPLGSTLCARA
jgi:transposase, IS6 family